MQQAAGRGHPCNGSGTPRAVHGQRMAGGAHAGQPASWRLTGNGTLVLDVVAGQIRPCKGKRGSRGQRRQRGCQSLSGSSSAASRLPCSALRVRPPKSSPPKTPKKRKISQPHLCPCASAARRPRAPTQRRRPPAPAPTRLRCRSVSHRQKRSPARARVGVRGIRWPPARNHPGPWPGAPGPGAHAPPGCC